MRAASRRGVKGHRAAAKAFMAGKSEFDIHLNYCRAVGHPENDLPYGNIVALNENGAVLHYQHQSHDKPDEFRSFLIDAGGRFNGYASDITRTYAQKGAHPIFAEALVRMESLQGELVRGVVPGADFVDLHGQAERGVSQVLFDLGILRGDPADAVARGLCRPFLPHGLGHHLGLQVHDVGGLQHSIEGDFRPPPDAHPHLRTTRPLAAGNVVTIEPGLYFIPMLLDPHRAGPASDVFDWRLIDELIPAGGIRVEDDILVTGQGCENLSRPWVPLSTQEIGESGNARP
jgi:Xaa-Pro dipeptidase